MLAGGAALKTPFGTFYGPNITPHREAGIGAWTDLDFVTALRSGLGPDGGHYFPVFPYTSYTGMSTADILALKAYIFTLPPSDQPSRPHEVDFPFGWRFLMSFWKGLYFTEGPLEADSDRNDVWNRGAYLVRALGHCGECHTPRNALGAADPARELAGTLEGPEGGQIPNITPHPETGIGKWSDADLRFLLKSGLVPSGDVVGAAMGEVVENVTSKLTDEDLEAMTTYLKSVPPIENLIGKAEEAGGSGDDW